MVTRTGTAAVVVAALLLTGATGYAQTSSKQIAVTSATVDRGNNTVTFRGTGFVTKKLVVYCEETPMSVLSVTDEELLVSFPASALEGTFLFTVVRGPATVDRAAFYVTTSRPQILEGRAGSMGPMGPQGPAGPAGRDGENGASGAPGVAGAQGPQGVQGDSGAAGPQGLRGETGAAGATGLPGAEGPQGPQGVAGPQGLAGPAGAAGLAGEPGLPGPQGQAGINGLNGVLGYERVVADSGMVTIANGTAFTLDAPCPAGKAQISGGYEMTNLNAQRLSMTVSAPYDDEVSGWRAAFRNASGIVLRDVNVRVVVTCVALQ